MNIFLAQEVLKETYLYILIDIKEVSKKLEVSETRIRKIAKEIGLIPIATSDMEILIELIENTSGKKKQREIAEQYGVTQQFVSYVKQRHLKIIEYVQKYCKGQNLWKARKLDTK